MHTGPGVAGCEFTADGDKWVCGHCGRRIAKRGEKPPVAACRPGLGDMVAAGLDAVGITKERVQRVASAVGIEDCGCAERQRRLNEFGHAIGLPPGLDNPSTMNGERSQTHATETTDGESGSGSPV